MACCNIGLTRGEDREETGNIPFSYPIIFINRPEQVIVFAGIRMLPLLFVVTPAHASEGPLALPLFLAGVLW